MLDDVSEGAVELDDDLAAACPETTPPARRTSRRATFTSSASTRGWHVRHGEYQHDTRPCLRAEDWGQL